MEYGGTRQAKARRPLAPWSVVPSAAAARCTSGAAATACLRPRACGAGAGTAVAVDGEVDLDVDAGGVAEG